MQAHSNVTLQTNDNELDLSRTSASSANLYIKVFTSQIKCQHPEARHVGFDPCSTQHTNTLYFNDIKEDPEGKKDFRAKL